MPPLSKAYRTFLSAAEKPLDARLKEQRKNKKYTRGI